MIIQGVTISGLEVYDASFNSRGALLYLNAGESASYSGTGTTWTDLSTNDNDATLVGSPTFTNAGPASYFSFNGTSGKYASTVASKYNKTYTGKTVIIAARMHPSAWTSGLAQYRCMFGSNGFRNFSVYMYHSASNNFQFHYSTGAGGPFIGTISNNLSVTTNQWFVMSVTHTTSGVLSYYLNGQLVNTNTGVSFLQYGNNTGEFVAAADNYWYGDIGVVAVYGRALSPDEIRQNYNAISASYNSIATSNLVAHYNPDSSASYPGSGTTLYDISGNNLNGTMSNISWTDPYFTFNGTNSQVTIADNSLLEPGSSNWTMEAWFNVTSNQTGVILGKFDPGGLSQDVSYSIRIGPTGILFAQIGNGSGAYINSTSYTTSTNTWYQVVYVWKTGATKTLETYINGVSVGSVNHSLNSILNTSSNLYIGSYNGGEYAQWFNGEIGATRLYNKALSATEVVQNYNASRATYGL